VQNRDFIDIRILCKINKKYELNSMMINNCAFRAKASNDFLFAAPKRFLSHGKRGLGRLGLARRAALPGQAGRRRTSPLLRSAGAADARLIYYCELKS
jgi:hypothetical protein